MTLSTTSDGSESSEGRAKRAANSWDHYVEVLVVADQKMMLYHGPNLEAYVLTLFSTVASIYRHASLKASMNIVVVRIIILKHENVSLCFGCWSSLRLWLFWSCKQAVPCR